LPAGERKGWILTAKRADGTPCHELVGQKTRHGVARQKQDGNPGRQAQASGLGMAKGHAVDCNLPCLRQRRCGMIIAARTSTADNQDEICAGQQQSMANYRAVARNRALFHDNAAVALDQSAQQWAVCVIYLAVTQRLSGLDRSLGEQAAHARLCKHANAGQSSGREQADIGSREPVSRRDQPAAVTGLTTPALNPAACNYGLGEDGPPQSIEPNVFQANNRIRSAWQGGTRIDPASAARGKVARSFRPLQDAWIVRAGADGLLSMHGKTVDGGPIDRRQV